MPIENEMEVNFGKAAKEYAEYRAGFPESFFERLRNYNIGLPGQTIVDLGTGTGTIARSLAKQGSKVIAIDVSEKMLEQAQALADKEKLKIDFKVGKAEQTGLPNASVDIVTAGQCWHWFDRLKTIEEVKRILKPKGKLVIAHFDWVTLKDNVVAATEKLISKYNPKSENLFKNYSQGTGFYVSWIPEVQAAGFKHIETFSFDVDVVYSHLAWRKRIIASAGLGPSLSISQVENFDKEHNILLKQYFPEDPLVILHRIFAIIANEEN